ncbi:DUF5993 family protein [Vibrio caribbeanicus]|uniref:DUF5993 family protein n=1 Tax=Vibrio caribbeanicus TaxID=701175 RepID=UPI0030DACB41
MMSLIFFILFAAMLVAFCGKKSLGYVLFSISVIVGLYWFNHHATDSLSILL